MHIDDVLAQLESVKGPKIYEVYHCTTFKGYRERRDGVRQELRIEILDAGPFVGSGNRYSCTVTAADGKRATGNSAGSIDVMLSTVHWGDLD